MGLIKEKYCVYSGSDKVLGPNCGVRPRSASKDANMSTARMKLTPEKDEPGGCQMIANAPCWMTAPKNCLGCACTVCSPLCLRKQLTSCMSVRNMS